MMAGNPNWWGMHPPSLIPPQYLLGSSSIPMNLFTDTPETPPPSWSQMLFSGLPGEEERMGLSHFQSKKLMENWEEESHQIGKNPCSSRGAPANIVDHGIKQEQLLLPSAISHVQAQAQASFWSNNNITANNVLDFAHNNPVHANIQLPHNNPSECNNNSTASAGVCNNKKARVQPSPTHPPLKVRKEKLGDRITALHQLVSPFGKTDTASVLLEAIGYIRFLQGQIEALSSPYLANASKNMRNRHSVRGERNTMFPEDPGQLLNDPGLKRKGGSNSNQDGEKPRDLRSRGLCLVPVSCTQHVGSEVNGADYWAPAYGSGF